MIRIAIVGCGRILNGHLQGYLKLREAGVDNFRITALVARQEEDARMFRRRGEGPEPRASVLPPESGDTLAAPHTYLSDFQDDVDVEVYSDYREMLEHADVDAVNDFTTLALHHQVGEAALRHGKHLLTQKPLAISVAAAQRMADLAREKGLTFGTFEAVRQAPFTRAAGWAVRKGLIGKPQMALTGSLGGLWSPDRVVADTAWRHRKLQAGGGGALDIGVHQFHLLRYVFGEVAGVSATARTFEPVRYRRDEAGNVIESVDADVDDTFFATANFDERRAGATAVVVGWARRAAGDSRCSGLLWQRGLHQGGRTDRAGRQARQPDGDIPRADECGGARGFLSVGPGRPLCAATVGLAARDSSRAATPRRAGARVCSIWRAPLRCSNRHRRGGR